MKYYSTFETAKILKIEYPRFRNWVSSGKILGELESWGRGYKTIFDINHMYSIKLFAKCIVLGIHTKKATSIAVHQKINWKNIIEHQKYSLYYSPEISYPLSSVLILQNFPKVFPVYFTKCDYYKINLEPIIEEVDYLMEKHG